MIIEVCSGFHIHPRITLRICPMFSCPLGSIEQPLPRPVIITLLLLHSLSPVLRTLTHTTTSDSIWPLAGGLFILGLLLGDYGKDVGSQRSCCSPLLQTQCLSNLSFFLTRLSSSLAFTSSLSASIVLASRLPTNSHVFALILFSILNFVLFPLSYKRLLVRCIPLSFNRHVKLF